MLPVALSRAMLTLTSEEAVSQPPTRAQALCVSVEEGENWVTWTCEQQSPVLHTAITDIVIHCYSPPAVWVYPPEIKLRKKRVVAPVNTPCSHWSFSFPCWEGVFSFCLVWIKLFEQCVTEFLFASVLTSENFWNIYSFKLLRKVSCIYSFTCRLLNLE